MTSLQFLGAAQTVTGSRFLLRTGGKKILIDCGLFQGGRLLRERNWKPFPLPPADLDAVVLTHGHIDHSGYLPRLVKEGYNGPVYCTPATADLLSLLLPDSGHLQEKDAAFANKKKYSRHTPALPLYTEAEARAALGYLSPVYYHQEHRLSDDLHFEYFHAGHILGSAMIRFSFRSAGRSRVLFASGDLGRNNQPVIKDPEIVQEADFLLLESTYGNRVHEQVDVAEALEEIVNQTVQAGGMLLIPSFAIGRSQRVLYHLRQLEQEQRIPGIPVFLDSPMAVRAVSMYCKYLDEHDFEMKELMEKSCPLDSGRIHLVRSVEESQALNERKRPCIIVAPSGNLAGGRILHHLKRRLHEPQNTVLFVGFQPQGSLGRLILEGKKEIRIHGKTIRVRARIRKLNALSAHADSGELLEWVSHFKHAPQEIFLVHGEPASQEALKSRLDKAITSKIQIPAYLDTVELA